MIPDPWKDGLRHYGDTSYNGGIVEDVNRCIVAVFRDNSTWAFSTQCRAPRGHGKDELFCKQHDPERVKAREDARNAKDCALRKAESDHYMLQGNAVKIVTDLAANLGCDALELSKRLYVLDIVLRLADEEQKRLISHLRNETHGANDV